MEKRATSATSETSQTRIRIAHCIHGLGVGGAQQVVKYLAAQAHDHDSEHFVYASNDGVFRPNMESSGATVRVVARRLPKLDPLWIRALARAAESDSIDLIHAHLFGDHLHAHFAARRLGGLPVVLTLHSVPRDFSALQRRAYQYLIPRVAHVVACSEASGEAFRKLYPEHAAKISVVPNGFDARELVRPPERQRAELRRSLGVPDDALLVGAVGRLVESKRYDDLIQAFERLRDVPQRPLFLVILGDGPLREKLEGVAADAGVSDRVVFAGFRADATAVMSCFDVQVFSSLYEGISLALLEGMALERCIVATHVPGIDEVLRDGREAAMATAGDVQSITDALDAVLGDETLRTALGQAARERFDREYTAQLMADRYNAVYRDVLKTDA